MPATRSRNTKPATNSSKAKNPKPRKASESPRARAPSVAETVMEFSSKNASSPRLPSISFNKSQIDPPHAPSQSHRGSRASSRGSRVSLTPSRPSLPMLGVGRNNKRMSRTRSMQQTKEEREAAREAALLAKRNKAASHIQQWWRQLKARNSFRNIVAAAREWAKREDMERKERARRAKAILSGFFWHCAVRLKDKKEAARHELRIRAAGLVDRMLRARRSQLLCSAKHRLRCTAAALSIISRWRRSSTFARVRWRRQNEAMVELLEEEAAVERREVVRSEKAARHDLFLLYSRDPVVGSVARLQSDADIKFIGISREQHDIHAQHLHEAMYGTPADSAETAVKQRRMMQSIDDSLKMDSSRALSMSTQPGNAASGEAGKHRSSSVAWDLGRSSISDDKRSASPTPRMLGNRPSFGSFSSRASMSRMSVSAALPSSSGAMQSGGGGSMGMTALIGGLAGDALAMSVTQKHLQRLWDRRGKAGGGGGVSSPGSTLFDLARALTHGTGQREEVTPLMKEHADFGNMTSANTSGNDMFLRPQQQQHQQSAATKQQQEQSARSRQGQHADPQQGLVNKLGLSRGWVGPNWDQWYASTDVSDSGIAAQEQAILDAESSIRFKRREPSLNNGKRGSSDRFQSSASPSGGPSSAATRDQSPVPMWQQGSPKDPTGFSSVGIPTSKKAAIREEAERAAAHYAGTVVIDMEYELERLLMQEASRRARLLEQCVRLLGALKHEEERERQQILALTFLDGAGRRGVVVHGDGVDDEGDP